MNEYRFSQVEAVESSVLGAVLCDPAAYWQIADMIQSNHFMTNRHQVIWGAVCAVAESGAQPDLSSVFAHLVETNTLDQVSASYISSMTDEMPDAGNVEHNAKIVINQHGKRQLSKFSRELSTKSNDKQTSFLETLDFAQSTVLSICDNHCDSGPEAIGDLVDFEIKNIFSVERARGIVKSGFDGLDNLFGGFRPQQVSIIAARPGVGKTALALNVAANAAFSGKKVAFFSLEMSKRAVTQRILASKCDVSLSDICNGRIGKAEHDRMMRAYEEMRELGLHIDDESAQTSMQIRTKSRKLQCRDGLDLIVIDYLQLMRSPAKSECRREEVSECMRQIKAMSKDLDIPIISLAQLSRAIESRDDKTPRLSDLRETGEIEQTADNVIFLTRGRQDSVARCHVGKNRQGATGDFGLRYRGEYTRFETITQGEQIQLETETRW